MAKSMAASLTAAVRRGYDAARQCDGYGSHAYCDPRNHTARAPEALYNRAVCYRDSTHPWGSRFLNMIQCIESSLDDQEARELRDLLVAQALLNLQHSRGNTIQPPHYWIFSATRPGSTNRPWRQHTRKIVGNNRPVKGLRRRAPRLWESLWEA